MRRWHVRRRARASALAVLALASWNAAALAAGADERDDAIQMLADLTLIDGQCRDLTVNFGIGFAFAAGHGLAPAAVMPAGPLRKIFESDVRKTQENGPDVLCGPLAMHYSIVIPGSITFPSTGPAGRS